MKIDLFEDMDYPDLIRGGNGPGPESLPEPRGEAARQRRLRLIRYCQQVAAGKEIEFIPKGENLPWAGKSD